MPLLVFIGVALAYYFKRRPEEDWEESHFQYLIRTFWVLILVPVTLTAMVALLFVAAEFSDAGISDNDATFALATTFIVSGVVMLLIAGVRTILSLMKSASHTPMPDPKSWLV